MDIISAVLYDCFPNWIQNASTGAKKAGKKTFVVTWFGNDLSNYAANTLYACVCPASGKKWLENNCLSRAHLIGSLKISAVHKVGSTELARKLDAEIFDANSILNLNGICTSCKGECKNRKKVQNKSLV